MPLLSTLKYEASRDLSLFRSCGGIALGLVVWCAAASGQAPRYGDPASGTAAPPESQGVAGQGGAAPQYGQNQLAPQTSANYPAQSGQAQPGQYSQQQPQPTGTQGAAPSPQGPVTPHPMAPQMPQEPAVPVNPFNVSEAEANWIDGVLKKWETDSETVKTFYAEFERNEFNHQFGPPGLPMKKEKGKVGYISPDQGSYEVTESKIWTPETTPPSGASADPNQSQQPRGDWKAQEGVKGDHWVCDGKYVYEHRFNTKQLVVTPIPPEMQGKEIVNGPLPFLFGAKAEDLKQRYWFRVARELCDEKFTRIGIHAKPKYQADLANFTDVYVILRNEPKELLMPITMRLVSPDRSHADYYFKLKDARINARLDQWFSGMFMAPRTPIGWTRVDEPLQQAAQPAAPAGSGLGQPQRQ